MKKPNANPKQPKQPRGANVGRRPVEVRPYIKNGKKVAGYKRRRAETVIQE